MWFFKQPEAETTVDYLANIEKINYDNIYQSPAAQHPYLAYEAVRNKNGYGIGSATIYNLKALFQNVQTGQSMQFSTVLKKISTTERIKANNYIHSIVKNLNSPRKDMTQEATWNEVINSIKDARTGKNSNFPKAASGTIAVIAMIYAEFLKKSASQNKLSSDTLNQYIPPIKEEESQDLSQTIS